MKTPKEYNDNLKKGIITGEMLADCLFSVNKRAKNCRDKEREARTFRYDYYNNEEKYREKKEEYYEMKDDMLSIVDPICIHEETFVRRREVYDYYDEYQYLTDADIIERHEYDNWRDGTLGEYVVVKDEYVNYYLFYDLGSHSFHKPIEDYELDDYKKKYKGIQVVKTDQIRTFGKRVNDLISMQFVRKVLTKIYSGNFVLDLSVKEEAA